LLEVLAVLETKQILAVTAVVVLVDLELAQLYL
jgi:hypothetical protein